MMGYKGDPIKMDDLGVPLFQETSISNFRISSEASHCHA